MQQVLESKVDAWCIERPAACSCWPEGGLLLPQWLPSLQVSLQDVCIMLQLVQAGAARVARGAQRAKIVVKASPRLLAAIAADLERRVRDDNDHTRFQGLHFATVLSCSQLLWPHDSSTPLELASAAATDIMVAPGTWSTRALAQAVVSCAEAELPAHRLFTAAATEAAARLEALDMCTAAGQLSPYAVRPEDAEGILWAYTVMRKSYRYSTSQVVGAVSTYLMYMLQTDPQRIAPDVLAEMLWSFAAMWHVPKPLFAAAGRVFDEHWDHDVTDEVAESVVWAFGRAGVPAPACCGAA